MSGSYYDVLALESRAYDIAHWIAMEARVAESLDRSVAPIESEGARRIVALASARPTPADVRERVKEAWATVEAAALAQAARVEEYEWNNDEAAEIRDAVAQVAALLSEAPKVEGDSSRIGLVGWQARLEVYGCDGEGITLTDGEVADLLAAIRAALRPEAQGDAEALAAADMERVPTTKGER